MPIFKVKLVLLLILGFGASSTEKSPRGCCNKKKELKICNDNHFNAEGGPRDLGSPLLRPRKIEQNLLEIIEMEKAQSFDEDITNQADFLKFVEDGCLNVVESVGNQFLNQADQYGQTAVWIAAANGHTDIVKFLAKKKVDLNQADEDGQTPISIAAGNGHLEVVKFLTKKNVDLNQADDHGQTPISLASSHGHTEIVSFLIENKVKLEKHLLNVANTEEIKQKIADALKNQTDFWKAVQYNCLEAVKLLADKVDLNRVENDGRTTVSIAAYKGHTEIVQFLAEKNANLDLADRDERTPVYWAAHWGHLEIVKVLARNKADLNRGRKPPIWIAACNGRKEVVKFLIEKKVEIDRNLRKIAATEEIKKIISDEILLLYLQKRFFLNASGSHKNWLQQALEQSENNPAIWGPTIYVQFLGGRTFDLNANQGRRTPILVVACRGRPLKELVKFLMEKKVKLDDLLEVAGTEETKEIISQLLREQKEFFNAVREGRLNTVEGLAETVYFDQEDDYGRTAVSMAAMYGHLEIVKFLAPHVNLNRADEFGRTPAYMATAWGHLGIVKFLAEKNVDLERADEFGRTLAHVAAANGDTKILRFLAEIGVDLDRPDHHARTPRTAASFAMQNGHTEAVKFFEMKNVSLRFDEFLAFQKARKYKYFCSFDPDSDDSLFSNDDGFDFVLRRGCVSEAENSQDFDQLNNCFYRAECNDFTEKARKQISDEFAEKAAEALKK